MTEWQPTNQPGPYDKERLAHLAPIQQAIANLGLPLIRQRKLNSILNALIMQIEDGGDSPIVNNLLIEALQAAVLHQVGRPQGAAVLRVLETFAQAEKRRWRQIRRGKGTAVAPPPAKRLPELVEDGYDLLRQRQVTAACDQWLAAWQLAQAALTPQMTRSDEFDAADPGHFHPFSDWTMELMFELHNAGLDNPAYIEKRLTYVRAFLARFPQEKADRYLEFRRAEGEALWALGRIAEAEAVYQALTQKLPDMAWGYIGWADHYYLFTGGEPKDYERAADILQQAWDRPNLDDRESVAGRLKMLYKAWGRPLPSWVKGGR